MSKPPEPARTYNQQHVPRRHTPGSPLPDLFQRLRVEDRPPARREGPCFNQGQDASVFGEFLRPESGDRIGRPPTVPLAGTF